MTFEEAKKIFLNRGYVEVPGGTYYDADKWRDAITVISKWLEQEPCEDCVSRQAVIDMMNFGILEDNINNLPSVTPKEKMGKWLRMSDLSEQKDDRYKCSYCGNVVHYRDKMNLYTFNRWCGRCGSNNGARMASE